MRDIPVREITIGKRTISNVEGKKCLGVVPVVLKPVHQKALADAADAGSSVIVQSADYTDLVSDVPIVEK